MWMCNKKEGIIILGHGSRYPQGRDVIQETAKRYQEQHPERVVRHAFVEMSEPRLENVLDLLAEENLQTIIVVPLFLSFGHHIAKDLPERMQRAAKRHPNVNLITTQPIGADPLLCDIIQSRIAASIDA